MKFLERSYTTRSRRGRERNKDSTLDDVFTTDNDDMNPRRNTLSKRPNTSAGIDEGRGRNMSKGWGKARDGVQSPTCSEDLHRGGNVLEITDGLDTFRFPTPSPRMPPRSATFQYSPSPLQYTSPRIGVAIGSPSHAPPNLGRSYTADIVTLARHQPPSRPPPAPPQHAATSPLKQEQRKKKTSWKQFSGLFRKSSKYAAQTSSSHDKQVVEESQPSRCSPDLSQLLPSSGVTSPGLPSPTPVSRTQHSRTPSWSRAHRRAGSRDQGEKTSHLPAKLVRGASTPSPRMRMTMKDSVDIFKQPQGQRRDSPMEQENINIELLQAPTASTPRLLLEFPKPEFERYSVMFEKLLANDSRPSLLERRQSKLHRKRSGQGDAGERLGIQMPTGVAQRSLTSPHLTSRLSIRVNSTSATQSPISKSPANRKPQGLQRSNTAPILAASPVRLLSARDRKETLESSPESPHSAMYSENSLPPTPTTVTTCTDTESIRRVLEQNEPAWQMVTSNPVTVLSPTSEKSELYARVKSPEDLERQIVQVSVARQVSVSRARSRVQKAMETKQPLRPRVVELTKNRKSTVGVLESAADEAVEPMPERKSLAASEKAA